MRIGIDLGGTKTEAVLMDGTGAVLTRTRRATPAREGYTAIVNNIVGLVHEIETAHDISARIGIGTPGALSTRTGLLKNANTTCLNNKPLKADLEKLLGHEIRMANDANCFALAEAIDGAAKGANTVFGVIMGTGVGGGIVFNGHVHAGAQHIAGEWGHNMLEADGPACYCGRRGCVETLISGPGLARDYVAHGGDERCDAAEIARRARAGETLAEEAMQRFLARFGRALSVVVNILDPDVIVLGGGLSNIDRLYTEGREHLARHAFNDDLTTKLVPNVHGDSAGVLGAARLWPAND